LHGVSGVVEFLTSGRVNANHRDFKEIGYDDCLCKLSFTSDAKDIYTHGFRLAQAYSRETLPFTNYTYVLLSLQSNPLNITSLSVTLRFMSLNSLSPASTHWI